MNFRKGDKVMMDKKKISDSISMVPVWYSHKIYTIIDIDADRSVASLNENLPNHDSNKIHFFYLKLLKTERKKKLLRLSGL